MAASSSETASSAGSGLPSTNAGQNATALARHEGGKLTLVPHEGYIWVVMRDVPAERGLDTLLFHTLTGESWLVSSRAALSLGFNHVGHCWLRCGSDTAWLWSLSQAKTLRLEADVFVQNGRDAGTRRVLTEDLCSHRPGRITARDIRGGYGHVDISGAIFGSPALGAFCFWDLGEIYRNFELDSRANPSAARWMLDRWMGWEATLRNAFGMSSSHVRKARPQQRHLAKAQDDEIRVLPYSAISTHGFLALAHRWVHSMSKKFGSITNTNGKLKLAAFLDTWLRGADVRADVVMNLDDEVKWTSPKTPSTSAGKYVVVPIRMGVVDLLPLHRAKRELARETEGSHWLCRSWAVPVQVEEVHIADLLPQLAEAGAGPIFAQLVWFVGTAVDLNMAHTAWPEKRRFVVAETLAGNSGWTLLAEPQEVRRSEKRKFDDVGVESWRQRDDRLYGYWTAGLKHFETAERQLSLAFDFSRVGGWPCGVLLLGTSENIAHWMPPQVLVNHASH